MHGMGMSMTLSLSPPSGVRIDLLKVARVHVIRRTCNQFTFTISSGAKKKKKPCNGLRESHLVPLVWYSGNLIAEILVKLPVSLLHLCRSAVGMHCIFVHIA